MAGKLGDVDKKNQEDLKKKGMTIITYNKDFFDQVLALPGVKALNEKIDKDVNGLGSLLTKELDAASK